MSNVIPLKRPTIILADPPWAWTGGKSKAPKYSTSATKELFELAPLVKDLAGKDALILMWVTIPTMADGMALLATWGFSYKSAMVWQKPKIGTGFYSRNNAEIVLIGRRGRPGCPQRGKQQPTIFAGKSVEKRHSSKPDFLHLWAEAHFPGSRKIELFARRVRTGWECLGNELGQQLTPSGIIALPASATANKHAECDVGGKHGRQGSRKSRGNNSHLQAAAE